MEPPTGTLWQALGRIRELSDANAELRAENARIREHCTRQAEAIRDACRGIQRTLTAASAPTDNTLHRGSRA